MYLICQKSSLREYKRSAFAFTIRIWTPVFYKKDLFFFQDGVGKRGRFIKPHWRNKGKGFKYCLPKLERFFFKVMDKANTEYEVIDPEQKGQCHEIFDFRLFS